MYFVTTISLLAVFLTYQSQFPRYRTLYKTAFILITVIACIHYNFGTDYDNYYDMYRELSNSSIKEIYDDDFFIESGWAFLNIVFAKLGDPLGFFLLVAILNVLQNYVYYKLIKNYVNPKRRWLAMAIYLFSSSFYIINFSMMRQGLAVSLIVLAVMMLSERKLITSIIIVLIASLIHQSALFFLPLLLLYFCKFKNRRMLVLVLWILVLFMFVSNTFVSTLYTNALSMQSFEDYAVYEDFGETSIGLGFFLNSIPYLVISLVLLDKKSLKIPKGIILMSVIMFCTLILTPITLTITLAGRLLFYFSAFSIVIIPNFYSFIKKRYMRISLTAIYIFMLLVDYSIFYKASSWAYVDYKTFHTIFEAL